MTFISNLRIDTFKGLENFTLPECGDVNIIVGDNNTCKTTVLEAIQFFQYPNDFREMIKISRKRDIASRSPKGITVLESFLNIFNAKQSNQKEISLMCELNGEEKNLRIMGDVKEVYFAAYELQEMKKYSRSRVEEINEDVPVKEFRGEITYNNRDAEVFINEITDVYRFDTGISKEKENVISMKYVSSTDHVNEAFQTRVLTDAILQDDKSDLLGLLNMFDINIVGLEILPKKNNGLRPDVLIKHKYYGFMSLSNFGDGLKKVLTLAAAILSINDGVLLIDEIETAIHTSALGDVFKWLLQACKNRNIQIFTTTHSDEALKNFLLNFKEYELETIIYRLENIENHILARRFSGEKASRIVIENGGDLM